MYKNEKVYKALFNIKRKYPMLALYHFTQRLPMAGKLRTDMSRLMAAVSKTEEIGQSFKHFTYTEWVFDNQQANRIFRKLSDHEKKIFNFDVTKIDWKRQIMNHGYGLKKFYLKEEAELPSAGYNDVITVR
jgi:hypothetical protein